MFHQKFIGIRSIIPITVQLPSFSSATPFIVFGPILKTFHSVLFVRYHETVEYIPSPLGGDENVLPKDLVLWLIFGFFTWVEK